MACGLWGSVEDPDISLFLFPGENRILTSIHKPPSFTLNDIVNTSPHIFCQNPKQSLCLSETEAICATLFGLSKAQGIASCQ